MVGYLDLWPSRPSGKPIVGSVFAHLQPLRFTRLKREKEREREREGPLVDADCIVSPRDRYIVTNRDDCRRLYRLGRLKSRIAGYLATRVYSSSYRSFSNLREIICSSPGLTPRRRRSALLVLPDPLRRY